MRFNVWILADVSRNLRKIESMEMSPEFRASGWVLLSSSKRQGQTVKEVCLVTPSSETLGIYCAKFFPQRVPRFLIWTGCFNEDSIRNHLNTVTRLSGTKQSGPVTNSFWWGQFKEVLKDELSCVSLSPYVCSQQLQLTVNFSESGEKALNNKIFWNDYHIKLFHFTMYLYIKSLCSICKTNRLCVKRRCFI